MTDSAALLADEVLPQKPLRQRVLSLPFALRFLLATDAEALTQVLGVVYRTISACVLKRARLTRTSGATGAVTLIQRFGLALNLTLEGIEASNTLVFYPQTATALNTTFRKVWLETP
jgi:hypothetical protein